MIVESWLGFKNKTSVAGCGKNHQDFSGSKLRLITLQLTNMANRKMYFLNDDSYGSLLENRDIFMSPCWLGTVDQKKIRGVSFSPRAVRSGPGNLHGKS